MTGPNKPLRDAADPEIQRLLKPPPHDPGFGLKVATAALGLVATLFAVQWVMTHPNKLLQFGLVAAGGLLVYVGEKRRQRGLKWGGRLELFGAFTIFPAVFYIWWPLTVLVLLLFAWEHFSDGRP